MLCNIYIRNTLSIILLALSFFAQANQTTRATSDSAQKQLPSLQDIALRSVFGKIVDYIRNLPGNPLPTELIVKQALDHFHIPPNVRAPIVYELIVTTWDNTAMSSNDIRTVLMSLLPFLVRIDETNPQAIPTYVKRLVSFMGDVPYKPDIVPWLMNLLDQASGFTPDREAFAREVIYSLIFERNTWSQQDKLAFINNIFTFIRTQQKELTGAMQLANLQGNRKKRRKLLFEMEKQHAKDVLGNSLVVPLSKLYKFITSDISGNNAFNAFTKISHTKNRFTYPLFAAVAMNDPIAVKVILGTGFDVNTLDSTRSNALNAAVNRGAYDIVIIFLNRSAPARIEHSIVDTRTDNWTIVFNVLDSAVVKADATMMALLLLLASNQLDDVMLERAQAIAEQNNLKLIAAMLDQAIEENFTPAYEQLAQLPEALVVMLPIQIQEEIKDVQ